MIQVKSKVTDEIGELDFDSRKGTFIVIHYDLITKETVKSYYKSLEDLCVWWCDYEEPKDIWYLDWAGNIHLAGIDNNWEGEKEIGNYFETKEEAEKAVEKLKAWKRLKDRGFSFEGYDDGYKHDFNSGHIEFYIKNDGDILNDLDLLFGGEE